MKYIGVSLMEGNRKCVVYPHNEVGTTFITQVEIDDIIVSVIGEERCIPLEHIPTASFV